VAALTIQLGKQILQEISQKHEIKRAKLVRNVQRAVEAYKFRYQVCTTEKLLRQQEEMLNLKRRKLGLKEKEMSLRLSGNTESPPEAADAGLVPEDDHVVATIHAQNLSTESHEPCSHAFSSGGAQT